MTKNSALIILLLLLSFSAVGAQEIVKYSAHINVDRMLMNEEIAITITNNHETVLRKLTYTFSGQVENLKTFDELGGLESEVKLRGGKNYVATELREPLSSGENTTVLFEFEDPSSVSFFNNTYILSTSFPLLANVKTFDLTLRLPEGTGLSNPDVDVVPAPSEITSDGRAIILKWTVSNPSNFGVFVRYEPLPRPTTAPPPTTLPPPTTPPKIEDTPLLYTEEALLGLVFLLLLFFSVLLALKLRSHKRIAEKIDILKEDEQLILKIVAEEDGIEQREIQRRTDFSKTKVSKILAELEKREAIRKESIGKKNKIYLTQKLKE